jgi:hypothetical protein
MKTQLAAAALAAIALTANAATIDMDDPLRSVGRENDVRVDAQLLTDTVSPGSPVAITWQIQNFSDMSIGVATRVVDASYDEDSRTITLTVGSEVPEDGKMPAVVLVAPGEKKVFRAAATPAITPAATRPGGNAPRYVQVKVSILRDLAPFLTLIEQQTPAAKPQTLSDALFEQWFESTDTIFLNTLPVQWSARPSKIIDVEQRGVRF